MMIVTLRNTNRTFVQKLNLFRGKYIPRVTIAPTLKAYSYSTTAQQIKQPYEYECYCNQAGTYVRRPTKFGVKRSRPAETEEEEASSWGKRLVTCCSSPGDTHSKPKPTSYNCLNTYSHKRKMMNEVELGRPTKTSVFGRYPQGGD